ncbi:MAG: metallophosphoesterase [Deltaproteobacteria bacterium]|jgi:hypothetical protein|nr:metallophosphoesterase [Deltaproteobacteria bacterium]MBW2534632.1 metallophosphoesterase [Deltaproteobacteria bacterium]
MRLDVFSRRRHLAGNHPTSMAALLGLALAAAPAAWLGVGCTEDACEGGCVPGVGAGTTASGTVSATGGGGTGGVGAAGGTVDGGPDAPPPVAYSFAVFGDNQFATTSCTSGVPERLAVPEAVRVLAPTFLLHTGDLMDHGYEDGAYAQLVSCYSDMLAEVPFFPTPGNHDMGSGGISAYQTFLEEQLFTRNASVWSGDYDADVVIAYEDDPNDYSTDFSNPTHLDVVPSGVSFETFYAMRFENALFLSFEQGTRWWSNTPKSWLETHLSAAQSDPSVEHVFVMMHHPLYSCHMAESASGECLLPVRTAYETLFRDYDVTIAFAGHTHLYDRFYVPDDGTPTRQDPPPSSYPHDGQGVHYLVTGGAGPLPSGCSPPPAPRQELSYDYLQTRRCGHHVTEVEVLGGKLTVRIIGVDGSASDYTTEQWDEFTIE